MTPLNDRQKGIQELVKSLALWMDLPPELCEAVALEESSMGIQQVSPTGARGCYGMTSIAVKDLLQKAGDGTLEGTKIGIALGEAFLLLLMDRYKGDYQTVLSHFCSPADRDFYVSKVEGYMKEFKG